MKKNLYSIVRYTLMLIGLYTILFLVTFLVFDFTGWYHPWQSITPVVLRRMILFPFFAEIIIVAVCFFIKKIKR